MRFLTKRIFLVFIIAFLGALFLEGVTRLFLSDKLPEPVIPNVGQFDERLGWSKIPLAHGVSERTGYAIEYRINSKGLRDEETTYKKPEDTFRIVLVGDSYTFGFGVPIEKHFSTLLEGYFQNVEVINMGIDGFGVDQELLYLRLEGFRYEPDLVLAYVPHYAEHRHMHTTRFGKNKPRFVLVDGDLVLTNSPVVDNVPVRSAGVLREIDRWFVRRSNAYQILHDGLLGWLRQAPTVNQQRRQNSTNAADDRFIKEMYELGEALIYEMHEDSLDHEAAFVLVTHIEELREAALKREIFSLNVSKPLSNPAYSLPHNLKHINESGNGVLAWEIAKFLQTNRLIPAEHLKD
jgi:hypothetical protein